MRILLFLSIISIGFAQSERWYVHNQHGYYFGLEHLNKYQAIAKCREKNAMLTSIHTAEENNFLKNISATLGLDQAWIGFVYGPSGPCNCDSPETDTCTACRRSWVWEDGSVFDYDEFHDWGGREPQGVDECARLKSTGWFGTEFQWLYNYICKLDIDTLCPSIELCQCDADTTECNLDLCCCSDPCKHGARCVGDIDQYACQCIPGYTGYDCETDIDDCQSEPCFNGGRCNDLVNAYACTCQSGYTGVHCETAAETSHNSSQAAGTSHDDLQGTTSVASIIGLAISAVLLFALLIVSVTINIYLKRRMTASHGQPHETDENRYHMSTPDADNDTGNDNAYQDIKASRGRPHGTNENRYHMSTPDADNDTGNDNAYQDIKASYGQPNGTDENRNQMSTPDADNDAGNDNAYQDIKGDEYENVAFKFDK